MNSRLRSQAGALNCAEFEERFAKGQAFAQRS